MSAFATELWPPELLVPLLDPDDKDGSAEVDVDLIILLESDFPLELLLDSDSVLDGGLVSGDGRWKGLDSVLTLSFSFDDLSESDFPDELLLFDESFDEEEEDDDEDFDDSELLDDPDLACSGLLELDFEDSDFGAVDDLDESDLELLDDDLDASDFWELDFVWPDRLAAKLARPLNGLAAPEVEESLDDEVLWNRKAKQCETRTASKITKGYPNMLLIIFIEIVQTGIILHAHPQVLFCNCVKLYQCWIILKEGLYLQDVDGGTNRLIPIYPQNYLVCRGIVNSKAQLVDLLVVITFSVIKRNLNTGG